MHGEPGSDPHLPIENGANDLKKAWDAASFELKRDVAAQIQKHEPKFFDHWKAKAQVPHFAVRDAHLSIPALGKALFREKAYLASQILVLYFWNLRKDLDEAFDAMIDEEEIHDENGDPERVIEIIDGLKDKAPANLGGFVPLYLATQRFRRPGLFRKPDEAPSDEDSGPSSSSPEISGPESEPISSPVVAPHSVAASVEAERLVTNPPCTRDRIATLERWLPSLEPAVAKAEAAAATLRNTGGVVQIGDLAEAAEALKDAQKQLDRAVARFSRCPTPCPAADLGCAAIREAAAKPNRGLADLLVLKGTERRLADAFSEQTKLGHEAAERIAVLRLELGESPASERTVTSLYDAKVVLDERRTEQARLEDLVRSIVERECAEVRTLIDRLQPRAASSAEREGILGEIRALVAKAVSRSTVLEAKKMCEELEQSWAPSRSNEDLAHSLQSSLEPQPLIELANALVSKHPLRALALLWLVQRTADWTFLIQHSEKDISSFVAAWLDVLTANAENPAVRSALPSIVAESWLKNLADVASEDVLPLQGFVLALAHASENAGAVAHEYKAFEAFEEVEFPALATVASCVRHRVPWVIVATPSAIAIARAREAVEHELGSVFVSIFTSSRKSNRFRDELLDETKPLLVEIWEEIRDRERLTPEIVATAFSEHEKELAKSIDRACEGERSETFFQNKIRSAIEPVRMAMDDYAKAHQYAATAPTEVVRETLETELARLGEADLRWRGLWKLTGEILLGPAEAATARASTTIETLFVRDPDLATLQPEIAKEVSSRLVWDPQLSDVHRLIASLASPPSQQRVLSILKTGHCADALTALETVWELTDESRAEVGDLRGAVERARAGLDDALIAHLEGCSTEDIHEAFARSRYAFVMTQLAAARERASEAESRMKASAQDALRELGRQIYGFLMNANESAMDEEWKASFVRHCNTIQSAIGWAQSPARTGPERRTMVEQVRASIETVRETVQHWTDLAALEDVAVRVERIRSPLTPQPRSEELDLARAETWRDQRVRLWSAFGTLKKSGTVNDAMQLVKDFCRIVDLYVTDEVEPAFEWYVPRGGRFHAVKTRFRHPGSEYFEKPVRVHLLATSTKGDTELSALREALPRDSEELVVVLVCGDAAAIRQRFADEIKKSRMTVVDEANLRKIVEAKRGGSVLRQILLRTLSVAEASPFKSEGHVSGGGRDIYVGRKEVLQQIVNGECWLVWGGRRSGKTSLLHAAKAKLEEKKAWSVVYESLESLRRDEDLDLQVARLIAANLEWPAPPTSIEEFGTRLEAHCREKRTALLLDELDAYLHPHLLAGRTEYPIIRKLRALWNKLGNRLTCIFAGFKDLYRVRMIERHPHDSSYPWHNFAPPTKPLTRLTYEETRELVQRGFEDVLGIELEPSVPQKIFMHTGGHPASVQHFCKCILDRIAMSTRADRDRRITEEDVRATFAERANDRGEQPFITFFQDTLEMNLGPLEHVIVYVIASEMIGRTGDPTQTFDRRLVEKNVGDWFASCSKLRPNADQYDDAFRFLVMTGMLDETDQRVAMAFRSYADILRRLEEAQTSAIEALIHEYERSVR